MKTNYFENCKTIEDAKKKYRSLMMKNHPDHGGSDEKAKEINSSFEEFCKNYMASSFENDDRSKGQDFTIYADILKKACEFNVTIEIIGFWIYCFKSYDVKDQLKALGFWFSKRHKAWVYSGEKKNRRRSYFNTNQIRERHGFEKVRDKKEAVKIA